MDGTHGAVLVLGLLLACTSTAVGGGTGLGNSDSGHGGGKCPAFVTPSVSVGRHGPVSSSHRQRGSSTAMAKSHHGRKGKKKQAVKSNLVKSGPALPPPVTAPSDYLPENKAEATRLRRHQEENSSVISRHSGGWGASPSPFIESRNLQTDEDEDRYENTGLNRKRGNPITVDPGDGVRAGVHEESFMLGMPISSTHYKQRELQEFTDYRSAMDEEREKYAANFLAKKRRTSPAAAAALAKLPKVPEGAALAGCGAAGIIDQGDPKPFSLHSRPSSSSTPSSSSSYTSYSSPPSSSSSSSSSYSSPPSSSSSYSSPPSSSSSYTSYSSPPSSSSYPPSSSSSYSSSSYSSFSSSDPPSFSSSASPGYSSASYTPTTSSYSSYSSSDPPSFSSTTSSSSASPGSSSASYTPTTSSYSSYSSSDPPSFSSTTSSSSASPGSSSSFAPPPSFSSSTSSSSASPLSSSAYATPPSYPPPSSSSAPKSRHRAPAHIDSESLGVGGLDQVVEAIRRRIWVPLAAPPDLLKDLGVSPVSGLLLHGPPGCGKSLLARKLANLLTRRPPTFVSGPEVLDRFVGASEANIRALFDYPPDIPAPSYLGQETVIKAPSMTSQGQQQPALESVGGGASPYRGMRSGVNTFGSGQEGGYDDDTLTALHVIVMDEFDAIAAQRQSAASSGESGERVRDSVVNQLLSRMDGVERLPHPTLVVALTNRLDLIDGALLRPGRFEVQLLVPPPDAKGRGEILKIHCRKMRDSGRLRVGSERGGGGVAAAAKANAKTDGIDGYERFIEGLAQRTEGWSGAELAGLVRAAASYALERAVTGEGQEEDVGSVSEADFERGLQDVWQSTDVGRNGAADAPPPPAAGSSAPAAAAAAAAPAPKSSIPPAPKIQQLEVEVALKGDPSRQAAVEEQLEMMRQAHEQLIQREKQQQQGVSGGVPPPSSGAPAGASAVPASPPETPMVEVEKMKKFEHTGWRHAKEKVKMPLLQKEEEEKREMEMKEEKKKKLALLLREEEEEEEKEKEKLLTLQKGAEEKKSKKTKTKTKKKNGSVDPRTRHRTKK